MVSKLQPWIIQGCNLLTIKLNKYLVNAKGQQLCIVVDGFDEYPTSL